MSKDSHTHRVMAALQGRRPPQSPALDPGLLASWMRSVHEHGLEPDRIQDPEVLTHAELLERRAPMEDMGAFASPEIDRLYRSLSDHAEVVMLADAQGVVMQFRSNASVVGACSDLRVLPGSVWNEQRQGTTGLGLCLREQRPLSVVMSEHFATKLAGLSCTVAPIFGAGGQLAGVLNVTAMHTTDHVLQAVVRQVVSASARRIENVCFDRRHARARVVRLSQHDDFSDAAAEARLAVDDSGRIIDATPLAARLLRRFAADPARGCADAPDGLIGRRLDTVAGPGQLERLLHEPAAAIVGPAGGRLHLRVTEPAGRGATPRPARAGSAGSLASSRRAAGQAEAEAEPLSLEGLVGCDGAARARLGLARRLHAHGLPLLLQGETGSGKTQLARALHADGPHRRGGFVAINCAAIPAELIESELFGHRPGAFTGASRQGSPGRLAGADGGTLFLDEIGDLPLPLQGRLLQVLSEGEFIPLGAVAPVRVRFALVSATLRDLQALVRAGQFREDLYHRISGAMLALPALRERSDRGELIARAFERAAAQAERGPVRLDAAARALLLRHGWPGNLRELQHVARYAVAVSEGPVIGVAALPPQVAGAAACGTGAARAGPRLSDAQSVLSVMEHHRWNVSAAAASLGISRATLHRRLHQFGLGRPSRPAH